MCRMLIGIGTLNMNALVDGMVSMAKDETLSHERNQENGMGTSLHKDGWGVAYVDENNNWQRIRSTKPVYNDPLADELRKLKTSLFIFHSRRAMGSCVKERNTHPFMAKDHGTQYVFCHNGYVDDDIPHCTRFTPEGECDSEFLFYSILTDLHDHGNVLGALERNFRRYHKPLGVNIVLSTKDKSYVAVRRNTMPIYLTMQIAKMDDHIIISSERLVTLEYEDWKPLAGGTLAEIDNQTREITLMPIVEREYDKE